MLASVYSYHVMVKSVSSCCVRGRWVLSNPVTFDVPVTLVSDNGPPFTFVRFKTFTKANGILCKQVLLHHPSSNRLAEKFVQTVKQALDKVTSH